MSGAWVGTVTVEGAVDSVVEGVEVGGSVGIGPPDPGGIEIDDGVGFDGVVVVPFGLEPVLVGVLGAPVFVVERVPDFGVGVGVDVLKCPVLCVGVVPGG
jgi:hypothetical protein